MNRSRFLFFLFFTSVFASCVNYVPCSEVTDKHVIGYYYSLNEKNRNKQYLQLMDNGTFINVYCDNKFSIRDTGTWKRNDCEVYLNGMRHFNTPMRDPSVTFSSIYRWMDGKLFLGEDDLSFKKTRKKITVFCKD